MNLHLEDVSRPNSVWMIHQHRWCESVCISESVSHWCCMCPKVWIGRSSSVLNLPSDIHWTLFSFRDFVSPVIRWESVCFRLEHSPLILRSDYCFLLSLPHLVSTLSLKSQYSLSPSFLKYDIPVRGLVFPTTVPCRLIVRFPPPWCH